MTNRIWASQGVYVSSVMTANADYDNLTIIGTAWNDKGEHADWTATVSNLGWHVVVRNSTGRETSGHYGGTFNLALEVSSMVRNAIGPHK